MWCRSSEIRVRQLIVAIALTGVMQISVRAQLPPAAPQSPTAAAAETLDALANTPGLTINTGQGCCPPPTIWDFLGCKQIKQHLSGTSKAIHELPLVKSLTAGLRSAFQAVGLAQPQGPLGPAPPPEGAAGANGGPGGGPGGGGAQGAGAVAAKIEANKEAAAATIQNLQYLSAQDCNRYPEVIPAILQELDNPDELVRYTAVTSLKKQCKNFRCSTLPATRILYRLNHSKFSKSCGCCCGCQCQDQVIVKLSDLLLDRNALGQPKERSHRIRDMAAEILSQCLDNRGRAVERQKRRVEPDPSRGPIPDSGPLPQAAPAEEKTLEFEAVQSATRLRPVPQDYLKAIADRDATDHEEMPREALGGIQLAVHSVAAENVASENAETPTTAVNREDVAQAELAREAAARLKALRERGASPDSTEYQTAYSQLCRSTLKLATSGHSQFEEILLEEASRWYNEKSSSKLSMMAVAAACCLTEEKLKDENSNERIWLVRRAKYLTFAADNFPVGSGRIVQQLMATADQCSAVGLLDIEQACLQRVADHFAGSPEAQLARSRLNAQKPTSPFDSSNAMSVPVAVAAPEPQETDETEARPTSAVPATAVSSSDSITATPVSLTIPTSDSDCKDCQQHRVFIPVPRTLPTASSSWLSDVPTVSTASEPPADLVSYTDSVGSLDDIDPNEPWFKMTELPADVYDRAFKALTINGQAMCFPECDDDVLRPYNNRSAIKLAPFSMFQIDTAQPGNVLRLGYRSVYGYDRPDRSEYFWPAIGRRGPRFAETGLNFQDFYFYNEAGSSTTSVFTEFPIRLLDPEVNSNTAGPGDIEIGVKSVLINDPNYVITSITRTITPIGVSRRGLGLGFLSLEQGLLIVWRIGRSTHLHGEAKFRYPIGADPVHGGEVIRTGLGLSRVLWSDVISPPQPDAAGLILTTELLFTSFTDGFKTVPVGGPLGTVVDADGTTVNHHVGLRRMWSNRFSTGVDFGYAFARSHLYDFQLEVQFQWLY